MMRTSTERTRAGNAARSGAGSLLVLSLAALYGCASVDTKARLPEVEKHVASRLDQKVSWNQNREEDRQAEAVVRKLLEDEITAEEAVQIALINNRGLQATYERLGIAQADLVQAGLLDNPVLGLQYLWGDEGNLLEATVMQEFLNLFTLSARKKIGAAAARQATLEVAREVIEVAAQVREAYFTALADAQTLELYGEVTLAAEAAAELSARQYQAGTLALRNQRLEQAFYAQAVLEAVHAEAQLAADRERLNRLLGLYGELTAWRMPARLPPLPPTLPSLQDIERAAIAQRLDLAAADAQVEALARVAGLTRSTRWLSVFGIGITYKHEPDGEKLYGADVELTLPLFDQGQARIARAQGELREAERRLEQLAIDIRSEARTGRVRLQASYDAAKHYRDGLMPLQSTIVDETMKFYNGMLVGVYDLLLARQAQVQTAREYIGATKEFWLAWAELERAAGGRIALPAATAATPAPAAPSPQPNHGDH